MSTVAEIYTAIQELSLQERCELEALLHPFEDDDWDKQMKRDAAAGKFGALHDAAEAEHAADKTIPLREKLAEAAQGRFQPGDRSNISQILSSLK